MQQHTARYFRCTAGLLKALTWFALTGRYLPYLETNYFYFQRVLPVRCHRHRFGDDGMQRCNCTAFEWASLRSSKTLFALIVLFIMFSMLSIFSNKKPGQCDRVSLVDAGHYLPANSSPGRMYAHSFSMPLNRLVCAGLLFIWFSIFILCP